MPPRDHAHSSSIDNSLNINNNTSTNIQNSKRRRSTVALLKGTIAQSKMSKVDYKNYYYYYF
jgi:hypothetical protein